jgi:CheY-like chemotaxis protein
MHKKARILVIDDDDDVRSIIVENLEYYGYDVTQARDGEQGLLMMEKHTPLPEIVITDIIMPNKEGIETIMEIRQKYPDVKLIAISGGGRSRSEDFLEFAKSLGSHAVIPKPIDMDELEKVISQL